MFVNRLKVSLKMNHSIGFTIFSFANGLNIFNIIFYAWIANRDATQQSDCSFSLLSFLPLAVFLRYQIEQQNAYLTME